MASRGRKRIAIVLTLAVLLAIGSFSTWTVVSTWTIFSTALRQGANPTTSVSASSSVSSSVSYASSVSSSPSTAQSTSVTISSSTSQATTEQSRTSPETPHCAAVTYPPPVDINYSSLGRTSLSSPGSSNPSLPGLTYFGNQSILVSSKAPVSLATNASGFGYGLFHNGTTYYLAVSTDFVHWKTTSTSVVPKEYKISLGRDLGVPRSGVVLVSATRLAKHLNFTVFRASYDYGRTFQTVLNISLRAKLENFTRLNSGPGKGFWHGVAEADNGYLFAGLYNPQGLIFRSTDNGLDWQLVFNASSRSDWHNEIHDLEVDPSNNFIYATTDDEAGSTVNQTILVSTDYGNRWATVYSAISGGAGLPQHLIPTSIGFLDGGKLVVIGLEGSPKSQFSRAIYILRSTASGCLQAIYRVAASKTNVDPFISWWMYPENQSSLFVLTHSDFLLNHTLGVALFALGDKGNLATLMTLTGENTHSLVFLQMTGPNLDGSYGILTYVDNHNYLLIVRRP